MGYKRHNWKDVHGSKVTDISCYGREICEDCGYERKKHAKQNWGRIIGYEWELIDPDCGKCKAHKDKTKEVTMKLKSQHKPVKLHRETDKDLITAIQKAAEENNRSFNGECLHRLYQSIK